MTQQQQNDRQIVMVPSKHVEMVALDLQLFAIIYNAGFHIFCHFVEPRYTLASDKHISQNLIPDMYRHVKVNIRDELKNVDHVAFRTDIWSSTCNNSLLNLTGHWIMQDFVRKRAVLNASSFVAQYTEDTIKNEVKIRQILF